MYLDPDRVRFARYFDWNEGKDATLFSTVAPTIVNGLGLLKAKNISTKFNFFSALSRFYSSAVTSDLPPLPIDQHRLMVNVARHWSITGEAVIVGRRAVRPDLVFPIYDQYDVETVTGYLFVYPQRKRQEGDWGQEPASSGSARVVEYDMATGNAYEAIREWSSGYVADEPKGSPVSIPRPIHIRSGDPPYVAVETVIREIVVRLNMLQLALNTTSMPLIQVDKDTLAEGVLRGRELTSDAISDIVTKSPLGLTSQPPFGTDQSARYIERSGAGLSESIEYVRLLLAQLGVLSGVPDYVYGVPLQRSNEESERILFVGRARINSFRRELEAAWRELGYGDLVLKNEPFTTARQRAEAVQNMVESGILTVPEARSALGYD